MPSVRGSARRASSISGWIERPAQEATGMSLGTVRWIVADVDHTPLMGSPGGRRERSGGRLFQRSSIKAAPDPQSVAAFVRAAPLKASPGWLHADHRPANATGQFVSAVYSRSSIGRAACRSPTEAVVLGYRLPGDTPRPARTLDTLRLTYRITILVPARRP